MRLGSLLTLRYRRTIELSRARLQHLQLVDKSSPNGDTVCVANVEACTYGSIVHQCHLQLNSSHFETA